MADINETGAAPMKSLRLDIEYPQRYFAAVANGDGELKSALISLTIIVSAVALVHGQGKRQMGVRELRLWSKIQNEIMDDRGKPQAGDIRLSDDQFDFIYGRVIGAEY